MCLDNASAKNGGGDICLRTDVDSRSRGASQILHGNKEFTANRFFDKAIQVVLADDGVWGINCEHSIAEALPHGFMNDFIYKSMYLCGDIDHFNYNLHIICNCCFCFCKEWRAKKNCQRRRPATTSRTRLASSRSSASTYRPTSRSALSSRATRSTGTGALEIAFCFCLCAKFRVVLGRSTTWTCSC